MATRRLALTLLCAGGILLAACGDSEERGLFTRGLAKARAEAFLKAVYEQDYDRAVAVCRPPFRYHRRTWDGESWKRDLKDQLAELRPRLIQTDELKAYSRQDLEEGRWPRERVVPEAERETAIRRLGVPPEGFVVRAYPRNKKGVMLILAPGVSELQVTGLLP